LFPRERETERKALVLTHSLGFPRIGIARELKRAQEAYWKGEATEAQLQEVAKQLRLRHWLIQQESGLDLIPVGDFSFYDHVLDTTAMLGAVPDRFGSTTEQVDLPTYFRMARGEARIAAMEMSKWFDTNYHYIVPEFTLGQTFRYASTTLIDQVREARAAGIMVKPVLVGPFTFLKLGKSMVEGFDRYSHLDAILPIYAEVLQQLSAEAEWIQIDEPALVLDLSDREQDVFRRAYRHLIEKVSQAKILLATYFESLRENSVLVATPGIAAVHIDLVRGAKQLDSIISRLRRDQVLSIGVVDGRNIWRVDAEAAAAVVKNAVARLGLERVMVAPSCSLLHTPVDLDAETALDLELRSWLAFAKQKCAEVRMIADSVLGRDVAVGWNANQKAVRNRRASPRVVDPKVRARVTAVTEKMARRDSPHSERKKKQQARLNLPPLPTTTIGSFPQTTEVRQARNAVKPGEIDANAYREAMQGFIREAVDRQHELGLDVLVHGEAERNDMVEYFGEQLAGIGFTSNGWVQSYGSRCVKPPVIFGDVSRPWPMTVEWTKYAQSLTVKPMKGMLTGPVTILCWSFVRDDQSREATCRQIALAIRDEVLDLEAAGVPIIQVDEAALREGLPLRKADWDAYHKWAVESFKLATYGVADETQLHTHMCYSEFNDIVPWIAAMDADVISIEASRSKMELLKAFRKFDYPNDIGPGLYDIHSPRVPTAEEMASLLDQALEVIPAERLWTNPDCGLKTRGWPETLASLRNMVQVAKGQREAVAS